jgi:probable HAF family extracellular repeat protein
LLAQPGGTRPPNSLARDVNDDGLVVGALLAGGYPSAFAWLPATGFVDLGTLPGGDDVGVDSGYAGASAYAVNWQGSSW